jgi:hypothetical protein
MIASNLIGFLLCNMLAMAMAVASVWKAGRTTEALKSKPHQVPSMATRTSSFTSMLSRLSRKETTPSSYVGSNRKESGTGGILVAQSRHLQGRSQGNLTPLTHDLPHRHPSTSLLLYHPLNLLPPFLHPAHHLLRTQHLLHPP